MSTAHLILQGKGGVGKSFAAFLLAQYLPDKSVLVRCLDADPISLPRPTSSWTGSSAFVPLLHYMVSNEVPAILSQDDHQLVVHTVVTGGQALLDTLHGAAQLVKQMDAARFVIWLNPFWGPVADNGRSFEQMNVYEAIKKRIETVVSLPEFTDELFPQDIASMLKSRLTFREAIESPDHSLMSRHRLKVAQREFYSRLDSLHRSVSVATSEGTRALNRSERSAPGAVGIAKGAP
jgi:hypothetical protein